MKDLKDWTKSITGLAELEEQAVHDLYADMLATAHDINYKVPDAHLVETEDAGVIRGVIPALHEGIVKFHASAKADAKDKAKQAAKAPAAPKKKTAAANAAKDKPKKPGKDKPAEQVNVSKETNMATATAKKAPAKKAAKKAAAKAPAKKAAKKAAAKNARTPVGNGASRNPFGENAKIKVLNKETGVRTDSERGKRIAVVFKYNGKKVADFFANEKPPFNRTDTLRFLIDRKFIEVK